MFFLLCVRVRVFACVSINTCLCAPLSGAAQQHHDGVGCNGVSSTMMVTQDYSALKENEICVSQGETVQVLATNQQNMYLVYRAANSQSPAAEGWLPGHILGPLNKTLIDSVDGNIK